jgi:ribonuclease HI
MEFAVAIFADGSLTNQLRYNLAEKFSNNEADQHAIVKALKKQVALIMLILALQFDVSTSFNM